jgi:hypothetical protein
MANFTERVQASLDDGYYAGAWFNNNSTFGFGKSFVGAAVTAALRFSNVTIPNGATITAATLTLRAENTDTDTVNAKVYGIDEDNTANFSADPTGRSRTTANADWDRAGTTANVDYTSPSLVSIVQEIVDRPGWSSGNAMGFIIDDDGSANDKLLFFKSYDGSTTLCALIDITYSTITTTSTTTTSTTTTSTSTTTTSTSTTTLPPIPELYGVKVLKPGVPSNTLIPKDFFLNSKYKMLKIHKQGSFKGNYVRFSGATVTIPFSELNYRPLVLVYTQRMGHDNVLDTNYHLLEWSYFGATKEGYQKVQIYNDRFVLTYLDQIVDDFVFTQFDFLGYYYVFREEVRE